MANKRQFTDIRGFNAYSPAGGAHVASHRLQGYKDEGRSVGWGHAYTAFAEWIVREALYSKNRFAKQTLQDGGRVLSDKGTPGKNNEGIDVSADYAAIRGPEARIPIYDEK